MSTARLEVASVLTMILLAAALPAQATEPDRDGDGLSDFMEVHKYLTDPGKVDSDGDGVADGDWRERREYQYTVRSVVQVMRPVTVDYLCDDYQDARVLDETPAYVELEVIHYPFNTVADAIVADPQWKRSTAAMAVWTHAGPTADWTPAMREALLAALRDDGIDAARLDDKTLVERAARWLLQRAEYHDGFSTFVTAFDAAGNPFVPDDLQEGVERGEKNSGLTLAQQWQREISARGMFETRCRGSCSSSAIYLDGCLRALGVPTRIVLCIPPIDASDDGEQRLVRVGLSHHVVRRQVEAAVKGLRGSWASHTFNEVFVGGRWRRLNYDKLGQGIFDPKLFGLCTHVATFGDWAEARMPETIGRRQKGQKNEDVFGGPNPYSTISLRDQFGAHCKLTNPEPPPLQATLASVAWFDDPALPEEVRQWFVRRKVFGLVARVEGPDSFEAVREFLAAADLRVQLLADGAPNLGIGFDAGSWWWMGDHALVVMPFGAADRRDLVAGKRYRVALRNAQQAGVWTAAADLHVTRR